MTAAKQYKKQGEIVKSRLDLVNEFIVSGKNGTFGEFLKVKKVSPKEFSEALPEDYRFDGIENIILSDPDQSEALAEYAEDLNVLYFEQYLAHEDSSGGNLEVAGGPSRGYIGDALVYGENTLSYYASGSQERKKKRAAVKAAKQEKKDTKNKIKQDLRNGSISKTDAKHQKKEARKVLRDKIGSTAGRAIGTFNKLNPVTVLMRNSFLSLVSLNAFGLGSALGHVKQDNGTPWKKMTRKWDVLGGNDANLANAINAGRKKNPFPPKKHSADGLEAGGGSADETNVGKSVAETAAGLGGAAAVAAATPGGQPVAAWITSSGAVLAAVQPVLKEFAKDKGIATDTIADLTSTGGLDSTTTAALHDIQNATPGEIKDTESFFDQYKYWIAGALALGTAVAIYFGFVAKKKGQ